jgi:hypothetical protein
VCITSLECRSDLYCSSGLDGGTGICQPLAIAGGTCTDPNLNADRCVYLGLFSSDSLHCSPPGDAPSMCVAGLPLAAACTSDRQCASAVCSSSSRRCASTQAYPSPATCTTFTKIDDAGAGGG